MGLGNACGDRLARHGPRQSSLQISGRASAKFQLRPKARMWLFSAFDGDLGAIQYSELVMTVSRSRSLPAIGVTAPGLIFGIWKSRVRSFTS